jgi:hypothetical protein
VTRLTCPPTCQRRSDHALAALHASQRHHRYRGYRAGRLCDARAGDAKAEPQIATVQHQWPLVKRRTERSVRTTVSDARSPHEVQVARNLTAILRGMRHAELERLAEVMPCKEGDTDCE